MALLQPLVDLAEICYAHGIRHVVISPGSRSAALTLAFVRHRGFNIQVVMDERAAAFVALGIAQQTEIPVVLICTSGSAAYNYAPAIAEAFFQQIPLLVLTADRPKEWIHQYDGQTIYQDGIYGKHVRKCFEFPSDYGNKDSLWFINRSVNEAIHISMGEPSGPVHINVPIREPFYPLSGEELVPSPNTRIVRRTKVTATLSSDVWHELLYEFEGASKILIVGGQYKNSARLNQALKQISEQLDIPVVGDTISNQKGCKNFITYHDIFLPVVNAQELRPDLLITYGLSLISKELKLFLRNNPAIHHWHISEDPHLGDSYQTLTRKIEVNPEYFFENVFEKIDYQLFVQNSDPETDSSFLARWLHLDHRSEAVLADYLEKLTSLNDLTCVDFIILCLDETNRLQLANSMSVRYVNLLGNRVKESVVSSNRGTSGIDGCVSTAIGAALAYDSPVFLITGDVAFLYDRNGLLINPLPRNLKIVVINNGGGNIFRMIDGPSKLPELEPYFETKHHFNAGRTAEDSGISYFSATDLSLFKEQLNLFMVCENAAILEVMTDPEENARVWKGLRQYALENW